MKTVSSLKNPAVQAARALRDARERARQGAFLLDGEHMVGEALAACPDRVSALFVDEARLEAYAALTALVPQGAWRRSVPCPRPPRRRRWATG